MTLSHKTCFDTSGYGFKKDPIRYQCTEIVLVLQISGKLKIASSSFSCQKKYPMRIIISLRLFNKACIYKF